MARKNSEAAQETVHKAMKKFKKGKLKSGSGGKVRSKKQAVAIGLSEALSKGQKASKKKN